MTLVEDGGDGGSTAPIPAPVARVLHKKVGILIKEGVPVNPPSTDVVFDVLLGIAGVRGWNPQELITGAEGLVNDVKGALAAKGITLPTDVLGSIVSALTSLLGAASMLNADNFAQGLEVVTTGLFEGFKTFALAVKGYLKKMGLGDLADNLDMSGDPLAFLGSIQDILIDEKFLTQGPLTFQQLLQYENRLSGIQVAVVLGSFAFSLVVEVISFGQVEGFVGLLIHMVDDAVSNAAKIVSTQLVRRAVADPFADGFLQIHRTKDASSSELEEAFADGVIAEEDVVKGLAVQGFTDEAIKLKVSLAKTRQLRQAGETFSRVKPATPSILEWGVKNRVISVEEAMEQLEIGGFNDVARAIYWARLTNIEAGALEPGEGGPPIAPPEGGGGAGP